VSAEPVAPEVEVTFLCMRLLLRRLREALPEEEFDLVSDELLALIAEYKDED
jgi:hypothetical protein